MATGFTFTLNDILTDFDDILVKRDIFDRGDLWAWGNNVYGNLGNNTVNSYSSPVTIAGNSGTWKQISAGQTSAAAIKTDGTLWTWGSNFYGQLGDTGLGTANRSSPQTTVAGGNDWLSVSIGGTTSMAIKSNGTLWTWGSAVNGQLGSNSTTVSRSSPQTTVAGGNDWKFVNCSYSGGMAIKEDGTLWTWGRNQEGQQGHGDTIDRSSPQTVISGGNNWKTASGGNYHKLGLKTDGTLWSWGQNGNGELGSNDSVIVSRSSPQTTATGGNNWKYIAARYYNSAAIKNDGTLWTWGYNDHGQIGNNQVNILGLSPQTTVAGGTNWKKVELGVGMMAAIKTDGTLWTWGQNSAGSLGDGNASTDKYSPAQIISTTSTQNISWKEVALSEFQVSMGSIALTDSI